MFVFRFSLISISLLIRLTPGFVRVSVVKNLLACCGTEGLSEQWQKLLLEVGTCFAKLSEVSWELNLAFLEFRFICLRSPFRLVLTNLIASF